MTAKDTFFKTKRSLVIDGKLCTFDRPLVMGILNITDDSFYDKGRFSDLEKAIDQFDKLIEEGADDYRYWLLNLPDLDLSYPMKRRNY